MSEQVAKPKNNKSKYVANSVAQKKCGGKQGFGFVDNRSESKSRKKLQLIMNNDKAIRINKHEINNNTIAPIQKIPIKDIPLGKGYKLTPITIANGMMGAPSPSPVGYDAIQNFTFEITHNGQLIPGYRLVESDCSGTVTGELASHQDAVIFNSHNPPPGGVFLNANSQFADMVGAGFPMENGYLVPGRVLFLIPVKLYTPGNVLVRSFYVKQEYIISRSKITLIKGGTQKSFRVQGAKPSPR